MGVFGFFIYCLWWHSLTCVLSIRASLLFIWYSAFLICSCNVPCLMCSSMKLFKSCAAQLREWFSGIVLLIFQKTLLSLWQSWDEIWGILWCSIAWWASVSFYLWGGSCSAGQYWCQPKFVVHTSRATLLAAFNKSVIACTCSSTTSVAVLFPSSRSL